jgi:hypothetical protein
MRAYYLLEQAAQNDRINCKALPWPRTVARGTSMAAALDAGNGRQYLLDYAAATGHVAASALSANRAPKAKAAFRIGAGFERLQGFTLGNHLYLMGYNSAPKKTGKQETVGFTFIPLDAQLRPQTALPFVRTHAPAVTDGFTEVAVLLSPLNLPFLFGYSSTTGKVATYTLTATATGKPPLLPVYAWDHVWAQGWTRFAHFRMGNEPFFLKTNIKTPNVNIDHFWDDLTKDSIEVATLLQDQLPDWDKFTICQSFYLEDAQPHFVGYQQGGAASFYRFRADCQGWTPVLTTSLAPGAKQILSVPLGNASLLILT